MNDYDQRKFCLCELCVDRRLDDIARERRASKGVWKRITWDQFEDQMAEEDRRDRRQRTAWLILIGTILGLLAMTLAGCRGCAPADFMESCSKSCGGKVVAAVPEHMLCICQQGAAQ